MGDQLDLIEGVRVPLPDCYDDVVEAMENARENGNHEIDVWTAEQLASDIYYCASIGDDTLIEDIEKSIKIWRERNAKADN